MSRRGGALHSALGGTPAERLLRLASVVCAGAWLAGCASQDQFVRRVDPVYGVAAGPRVIDEGEAAPRGRGVYRIGRPYTLAGRSYVPAHDPDYRTEGLASWYGGDFHGRFTANGEVFDAQSISAAHPTLPMPSHVRVTNLKNRRSIIVRVNDRGPFAGDRVLDVSAKTAELLGFKSGGLARVRVEYVGPAPLEGSEEKTLLATLRHDGQPAPAPSAVLVASTQPFVPDAQSPVPAGRPGRVPPPPQRPYEVGSTPVASATAGAADTRVARPAAVSASVATAFSLTGWGSTGAARQPAVSASPVDAAFGTFNGSAGVLRGSH